MAWFFKIYVEQIRLNYNMKKSIIIFCCLLTGIFAFAQGASPSAGSTTPPVTPSSPILIMCTTVTPIIILCTIIIIIIITTILIILIILIIIILITPAPTCRQGHLPRQGRLLRLILSWFMISLNFCCKKRFTWVLVRIISSKSGSDKPCLLIIRGINPYRFD